MRIQSEKMSNKLPDVKESAIAFCLASDWLRRWDKFSGPVKVQSTILLYWNKMVCFAPWNTNNVQFETKHMLDLVEFLSFLHVISRLPAWVMDQ